MVLALIITMAPAVWINADTGIVTVGWELGLTPAEQGALSPGIPRPLPRRPDVLVVGAGVVGLATALMCRRAGMSTLVLEKESRLGAGPSGRAAGVINPDMHLVLSSPAFAAMARAGADRLRELDREWGGEAGYREISLLVSGPEAQPLVAAGAARRLTPTEVRRTEPEAAIADVVELPGQAVLDPLRLCLALARRAGPVATGVTVDLPPTRGTVTTSAGTFAPSAVVIAVGNAGAFLPGFDPGEVKGHLLATAPVDFRLNHALYEAVLVRSLDDGRILAGSTFDADDLTREPAPARMSWIREQLARIVPRAERAAVEAEWSCFRPVAPDLRPVVDRLPGADPVFVSLAHFRTGIMMAPILGELLAGWIAGGPRPPELEQFSLGRRGLERGFGAPVAGYSRGNHGDSV